MIFCTIGTQAPFDRFIKVMDQIALSLNEEIIAQTLNGTHIVKNMKVVGFLAPNEFNVYMQKARIIVAHAGMGTIISALQQSKPIIIFPRIAKLGEHRNEHQLATAKRFKELGYLYVANNAEELGTLLHNKKLQALHQIGNYAQPSLINAIADEIT